MYGPVTMSKPANENPKLKGNPFYDTLYRPLPGSIPADTATDPYRFIPKFIMDQDQGRRTPLLRPVPEVRGEGLEDIVHTLGGRDAVLGQGVVHLAAVRGRGEPFEVVDAARALGDCDVRVTIEATLAQLGGEVAVVGKVFGPWTLGYHLFGVEEFLVNTILKPEAVRDRERGKKGKRKKRLRRKTDVFIRQGEWFFIPAPDVRVVTPENIAPRTASATLPCPPRAVITPSGWGPPSRGWSGMGRNLSKSYCTRSAA